MASVVGVALGAALELCIRLPLSKRYSWAQYADKLGHMHEEPSNPIAGTAQTACLRAVCLAVDAASMMNAG